MEYDVAAVILQKQESQNQPSQTRSGPGIYMIFSYAVDRFKYRTRYFTDSGIIGTKAFVTRLYQTFKDHFSSKHEKRPKVIKGLDGIYSMKRLSEKI